MTEDEQQQVDQTSTLASKRRNLGIEQAVRECVDQCNQSDCRALCISEFMLALRHERNWTMADVLKVGGEALARCRDSRADRNNI